MRVVAQVGSGDEVVPAALRTGPDVALLVDAIRRVHAGLRVVDPTLAAESLGLGGFPLTGRELDVLAATADGGTVSQTAARLFLSEGARSATTCPR